MREIASKTKLLLNFTRSISSSPPLLSTTHLLQSFNGELGHKRLLQLLQECSRRRSLDATKSLHALAITMGYNFPQPIYFSNNIVSNYVRLGEISLARQVFDQMPMRNAVSYNTVIGAYSRDENVMEVWNLFYEMRVFGFEPTQFTFGGILSCSNLDLWRGFYLLALIAKSGFLYVDAFAGTAFLGLLGRHGCFDEVLNVFEDMPLKNLVTWNSLISLCGQHGLAQESVLLFLDLMETEEDLSEYSFVGVLSGLMSGQYLELGEQVHSLSIKHGLDCKVLVANALTNMYVKCSCPNAGVKMFWETPVRDAVSWNTIIGGLTKSNNHGKSLEYFVRMHVDRVGASQATFVSAINSCTSSRVLSYGKFIHAKVIKYNFDSDVFVGSALVDFYAKHDELEDAHCCFDDMDDKNVVSWNSLLLGYSKKECGYSVSLLEQMIRLGIRPNETSFSTVLASSFITELLQLHSLVIKLGYLHNEYVSCSLITSYARNGLVSDALNLVPASTAPLPAVPSNVIAGVYNRAGQYHRTQELYTQLVEPDRVSWNILLAACSRNGDFKEVFELFRDMQVARIYPDNYTYVTLVSVCTELCNLALGSSLHGLTIKTNFEACDTFVNNVMINMYGKCGSLESSVKIFDEMKNRNLISWTALISTLGLHGRSEQALQKFREMEAVGLKPDGVALVAVLSACRHGGLVDEGREIFCKMKASFGIEPDMDHYLLMVDILTRYGHLKEAEKLILSMPFPPNALIWRSFLDGCRRKQSAANHAHHVLPGKQPIL